MVSLRKHLPWSAAALLALFAVVLSAAPAQASDMDGDAVCIGSAQQEKAGAAALCFQAFCSDASDCWNACPSAQSVACVNDACEYTYRGGGGGGGGGGPICHAQFCSEDSNCNCNGRPGYCGTDYTCHF
ncbi:hypothetical protein LZ198_37570 [Myxococcus sp. K15C18031901]|uniref:hypothetical protein n=1 Tax=Myxococcus dinghuensis TaxID=2906761 RepID=UPI0020A71079|nr:hypothetical protein [Myxococcus dinghuensis]MCP3104588.1 hypothetical protein [Myxococcus dinghuensis]